MEDTQSVRRWLGVILALLGAAAYATTGIFIKLGLSVGIDTLAMLTWRSIIAMPLFMTVGIISYRRRRAVRPTLRFRLVVATMAKAGGAGLLGCYVSTFLDFSALNYITAQLDRLIILTYPFFVVLFGVVFLKRKLTSWMVCGLIVSYFGLAVILAKDLPLQGATVVYGCLLALVAAMTYAAYQILAKPLIDQLGARLFTSIAMVTAGQAVIAHFTLTHPLSDLAVNGQGFWLMICLAVFSTLLPAYFISAAVSLIGPERTAVFSYVAPVVTAGLAIGVLGEAFTIWHAVGTACVLIGVALFELKNKPARVAVEASALQP